MVSLTNFDYDNKDITLLTERVLRTLACYHFQRLSVFIFTS